MKFILLSVSLAHSAVVYTVCAPFSGGFFQMPKQNCTNNLDVCVIPVAPEGCRPGPFVASHNKKKHPENSMHLSPKRPKTQACILRTQPGQRKDLSHCGWQMSSDLSVSTPRDITIHFTIDPSGRISHVTVSPFSSTLYKRICNQLNKIHFTWQGAFPPPACSRFEKRILIR